jgi:hypothetical protein
MSGPNENSGISATVSGQLNSPALRKNAGSDEEFSKYQIRGAESTF